MTTQTRSTIQDHENTARGLFSENPQITLSGFCARMQAQYEDLKDEIQLHHYFNQARAAQNLAKEVERMKELSKEMSDLCNHILSQQAKTV